MWRSCLFCFHPSPDVHLSWKIQVDHNDDDDDVNPDKPRKKFSEKKRFRKAEPGSAFITGSSVKLLLQLVQEYFRKYTWKWNVINSFNWKDLTCFDIDLPHGAEVVLILSLQRRPAFFRASF